MQNIINQIINISEQLNNEVFLVGGYLRDLLLKKTSFDMDLAVSKDAKKFSKLIAEKFNGKSVILHEDTQTYRVILFNNPHLKFIDISLMQGENIEQDLQKRDFTVNAFALNIKNFQRIKNNLIDNFQGLKDLKNKKIKAVSKDTFKDDPLRILRAFRIACEYKFNVEKETLKLIKKSVSSLSEIAPERIRVEFFRILENDNSSFYLSVMDDTGILEQLFPVITVMKHSAKNFYYHPKGLFQHCFQTYEAVEKILAKRDRYFSKSKDFLNKHFEEKFPDDITRKSLLKFSALFHDCAKPECAQKVGRKMRFFGHEELGAKKAVQILQKLAVSKKERMIVKKTIQEHMRPSNLTKVPVVTVKAQHRLFRDLKENTPDILMLAMADWHSYRTLKIKVYPNAVLKRQEKTVADMIFNYFEFINQKPKEKIIDGYDLMKAFKLKPGKIIGELLRYIDTLQEDGKVKDKKQALYFAKGYLNVIKEKEKNAV